MPEFLARWLAPVVFRLARWWFLSRSDKFIAANLRLWRRLTFALSADQFLFTVMGDLAGIFETGGWETELVRRIIREATPEYAVTILRSLLRKD